MTDVAFDCMGCRIRLVIGEPADPRLPSADAAAGDARRWLATFDARLSRFRGNSELAALNADPREAVPASDLLRAAVGAGLWAAERTNGLVDPTLVDEIEAAGYVGSPSGPAPVAAALASAPPRRPARPSERAAWRSIRIDGDLIHRPAGVRFDTGGTGKGLAADALAHRLAGYRDVTIDCAGDVRVAGIRDAAQPIEVEHPLTGAATLRFAIGSGAVATSGIGRRIWRNPDGSFGHHLIDPAGGRPAWTGLIQATAIAPTALEAETLAKQALLAGPEAARFILAANGGLVVHDNGDAEPLGALRELQEAAA